MINYLQKYIEQNIVSIRELGLIPKLIKLLISNKNEGVLREIALCLKNLAMNSENCQIIRKLNGVEYLLQIYNSTKSESLKKIITFAIRTITKNVKVENAIPTSDHLNDF